MSVCSCCHPLLCCVSEENCRTAVGKGYVAGLLMLYEEWHTHDSEHQHLPIRQALLHCLHKATNTSLGRSALVTDGGIGLLYRSTQVLHHPNYLDQEPLRYSFSRSSSSLPQWSVLAS